MNLKTILTLVFLFSINFLFIQFSFAQNEAEPSTNIVSPTDSTNPANPLTQDPPNTPEEPSLNAPPIVAPGPMKVLTPPAQPTEQNPDPLPETTTHPEEHPIAPSAPNVEETNKVAKDACNGINDCTGCMDKKIVKIFCCTSSKKRSENHEYAKGCSRAEIESSN
jgi:type IV secretory pathway VirB10-like protein